MAKRSFAVIGLSSFGYYLALDLAKNGHDVIVIDNDPEKIEDVKDYVTKAVEGDASDRKTLQELEITHCDVVVVSLGTSVDVSILATLYLKEMGVKHIMVKAISEDQGRIVDLIGADSVVFPERDTALRVSNQLRFPNVIEQIEIGEGLQLVELAVPDRFVGKTLADLNIRHDYNVLVVLIRQTMPARTTLLPDGSRVFQPDEVLVLLGEANALEKLQQELR